MKKCWCGNEELSKYSEHYNKCSKCGTLISDVDFSEKLYNVDDDKGLYGEDYWKIMMTKMTGQTTLDGVVDFYLRERVIYWIQYIIQYIPFESKIAEIGCGLGQLAYVMKQLGYNQTAFELSPAVCRYIKEQYDIDIVCGEFKNSKDSYDAILAFDLFEHIITPVEFLRELKGNLTTKGVLCLQLPRYDEELSYKEMLDKKPRFSGLLTEFQHVYLYSTRSIEQLLKQEGFQYIQYESAMFGDDYDMFLFASRSPLHKKEKQKCENDLKRIPCGRLVKTQIELFNQNIQLTKQLDLIEKDSQKRLENINELTDDLRIAETDRLQRLNNVKKLTSHVHELQEVIEKKDSLLSDKEIHIATICEENERLRMNFENQKKIIDTIVKEHSGLWHKRNVKGEKH